MKHLAEKDVAVANLTVRYLGLGSVPLTRPSRSGFCGTIFAARWVPVFEKVHHDLGLRYPELWSSLPEAVRERIHHGIQDQLPDVARAVNAEIGAHIDELIDVKLMVVRLLDERPELTNRLFHEVGRREFRFIMNFGFVFGFVLGLPTIPLVLALPYWWVLPLAEAVIGAITNAIGLWLIFEPVRPRRM